MHQEKRLTQKRQTEEGLNLVETHIEALMHDASVACAAASIKHQTDKKLLSQYAAMHLNDGSPLSQSYILSQAQELQVQHAAAVDATGTDRDGGDDSEALYAVNLANFSSDEVELMLLSHNRLILCVCVCVCALCVCVCISLSLSLSGSLSLSLSRSVSLSLSLSHSRRLLVSTMSETAQQAELLAKRKLLWRNEKAKFDQLIAQGKTDTCLGISMSMDVY
jgi:hypothetical protein